MEGFETGRHLRPSPEILVSLAWDGLVAGFSQLPDRRKWVAKVNHFKTGMVANSPHVALESTVPPPSVHLPKDLNFFPWLPQLVENCLGCTWNEHLRTTASGGKDRSREPLAVCSR